LSKQKRQETAKKEGVVEMVEKLERGVTGKK